MKTIKWEKLESVRWLQEEEQTIDTISKEFKSKYENLKGLYDQYAANPKDGDIENKLVEADVKLAEEIDDFYTALLNEETADEAAPLADNPIEIKSHAAKEAEPAASKKTDKPAAKPKKKIWLLVAATTFFTVIFTAGGLAATGKPKSK